MSKSSIIENLETFPLNLALKHSFITALGRKNMTRNVLLVLKLSNGVIGYGEASSSLAIPSATQEAMTRELLSLKQDLKGMTFSKAFDFIQRGRPEDIQATSFSALEMALYDAKARLNGVGLYQLFGREQYKLETSLTVSAWPQELAKKFVRKEWINGFRRFKIKVGTEWDKDLKRVLAVHQTVPQAVLILDGNQGFTVPGIIEFINELERRNVAIEFLEQPLPKGSSWEEWALLKDGIRCPIALDESIATCQDAEEHIYRKTVDIINIKLAKSGLAEALKIIRIAKQNKIRLMIGCMAESVVGLTTSVHLASASGAFDLIDLDSSYLLKPTPKLQGGFEEKGPFLKVLPRVKGSGVRVQLNLSKGKRSNKLVSASY